MVIKQDKFQALCKCNTYTTFGNHTGFKFVEWAYDHLVVGEWYSFTKGKYSLDIIINDKTKQGNGYNFHIPIDSDGYRYINEHINFYHFFSTMEEARDLKLKIILE